MKNIVQFITEALSDNDNYPITQMFNEQCKPTKTLKDLKKGDNECYLLLMNNESHKLIKELIVNTEVDENTATAHVKDVKDTPKWFKRVNMNTNGLIIYYEGNLMNPNEQAVKHWYSKNNETLFMVWNKENKDKFIKWYEDLTDEAYQQWAQDKKNAKKLAEEEKEREARAKIEANKKNVEKEIENWPDYLKELRDTYKLKVGSIDKTGIYFNVSSKLKSAAESIMNKYGYDSDYDEDSIKLREELNNKLTQDILKGTNYKFTVSGVWQRNSRGRWRGDFYGDSWADLLIRIYDKNVDTETGFNELAEFEICAGRKNHSYGVISIGYNNKKDDINKYVEYLVNAFNYIVGNK